MIELTEKRNYTSKTFDNEDGTFRLQAHIGHIHYKDGSGNFQDVDYLLEDMGTYWQMTKANYRLYIAKNFGDADLIRFDNRFNGRNHSIYFEPDSFRWVHNPDLSDMSTFRNAQAVIGTLTQAPNGANAVIRYENAFGDGIHYEIILRRSGFRKEIVIDALNKLENPPTANHRLAVIARYRGQGLKLLKNDMGGIDWDENGYYESTEGFKLEELSNRAYRTWIRPAYIEEAPVVSSDPTTIRRKKLRLFWTKRGTNLWQAKILPNKAWFQNANFPVRADASATYYSGAGDGSVIGWGDRGTDWDTLHDIDPATVFNYTSVNIQVTTRNYAGDYYIQRGFLPFYTEDLPDGATISAADLDIWIIGPAYEENNSYCYISIVGPTTQASTSSLTGEDADQCGAVDDPQKLSADYDIDTFGTGQYETLSLNATGLSIISKTGWTKLGLREGHDQEDVAIGYHKFDSINMSSSEETGTSQDPTLDITYSAGQTINFSTSINGQTSTPNIDLAITRELSASAQGVTTTPAIDLNILRELTASMQGVTVTSDIDLISLISFAATIAAVTQTPNIDLNITRALSASAQGVTTTPAIDLNILRELTASMQGVTVTSDIDLISLISFAATIAAVTQTPNIDLNITRALSASAQGVTTTPAIDLNILRELTTSIQAATVTSDIELTLAGIIAFAASISGVTATSNIALGVTRELFASMNAAAVTSTIDLTVLRSFLAAISTQTSTSDIALSNLISLAASISGQTITPSISMAIAHALTASIQGQTNTVDIILKVSRQLSTDIDAITLTSAINLILAGLGVILDPSIESLTTIQTISTETISRRLGSLTTQRTINKT